MLCYSLDSCVKLIENYNLAVWSDVDIDAILLSIVLDERD